jgi:hypothetical protein
MNKIPPSERISKEIEGNSLPDILKKITYIDLLLVYYNIIVSSF